MRANSVRGVIVSGVRRTPKKKLNSVRGPFQKKCSGKEIHAPKAPENHFALFFIENLLFGKSANSARGFGRPGVHRNIVTPVTLFAPPSLFFHSLVCLWIFSTVVHIHGNPLFIFLFHQPAQWNHRVRGSKHPGSGNTQNRGRTQFF